jgi:hypothetical protein
LAASEITATGESYHAEGVKTWVVLIAHVPHSRDALTRAKAAKGAKGFMGVRV